MGHSPSGNGICSISALNLASRGVKLTNFPANQLITVCAFLYLCFCLFYARENWYNVNIKIFVCKIIGPAAAQSAGPVPTPVWYIRLTCIVLSGWLRWKWHHTQKIPEKHNISQCSQRITEPHATRWKLWEMFVTSAALKHALLISQWSYGHFLKLTDSMLFE